MIDEGDLTDPLPPPQGWGRLPAGPSLGGEACRCRGGVFRSGTVTETGLGGSKER